MKDNNWMTEIKNLTPKVTYQAYGYKEIEWVDLKGKTQIKEIVESGKPTKIYAV